MMIFQSAPTAPDSLALWTGPATATPTSHIHRPPAATDAARPRWSDCVKRWLRRKTSTARGGRSLSPHSPSRPAASSPPPSQVRATHARTPTPFAHSSCGPVAGVPPTPLSSISQQVVFATLRSRLSVVWMLSETSAARDVGLLTPGASPRQELKLWDGSPCSRNTNSPRPNENDCQKWLRYLPIPAPANSLRRLGSAN